MKHEEPALEFYTHQNRLFGGLYIRAVADMDRDRVELLHDVVGAKPQHILELGSGGGQFAIAAAQAGHSVVAIELSSQFVAHAQKLAEKVGGRSSVEFIQEDFREFKAHQTFDTVVYWDGFGIGSDDDQKKLLRRLSGWLKPGGAALIDIYTPWHAFEQSGTEMNFGNAKRKYGYDAESNRMLDTWWDIVKPEARIPNP